MVVAKVLEIRNDRKYSLIRPFWFEVIIEADRWKLAVNFGIDFSIHTKSKRLDASFWLAVRFK